MFSSSGTKYIDDMFFYFGNLKFTNLTSFFAHDRGDSVQIVNNCDESLTSSNVTSRYAYARASKLLRNLTYLLSLDSVLNNIRVNFDLETYSGVSFCPLIAYNT